MRQTVSEKVMPNATSTTRAVTDRGCGLLIGQGGVLGVAQAEIFCRRRGWMERDAVAIVTGSCS